MKVVSDDVPHPKTDHFSDIFVFAINAIRNDKPPKGG